MLEKQRPVGIGKDLFTISVFVTMVAAKHFSMAIVCFFGFGSSLLTVSKSFIPFSDFFPKQSRLSDTPKLSNKFSKS
jgi:hypothetical protein